METITFAPVRFNVEDPLRIHDFDGYHLAPLEIVLDIFRDKLHQIPGQLIIGRRLHVFYAIIGTWYEYETLERKNGEWQYYGNGISLMSPENVQDLVHQNAHWAISTERRETPPSYWRVGGG